MKFLKIATTTSIAEKQYENIFNIDSENHKKKKKILFIHPRLERKKKENPIQW